MRTNNPIDEALNDDTDHSNNSAAERAVLIMIPDFRTFLNVQLDIKEV